MFEIRTQANETLAQATTWHEAANIQTFEQKIRKVWLQIIQVAPIPLSTSSRKA